jgi:carbon-monoxide dehydrogenase small subunit
VTREIEIIVNGEWRSATAEVRITLADFLRDKLGLTGTHLGCEHGVCGACTVMVDGVDVRSCLMLAVQAQGKKVLTVEGLGDPEHLHPLQQALRESHAFQCGFCTPGFVMASLALLRENPMPDEAEVREVLSGNICRCTGYQSIVEGVLLAAERGAGQAAMATTDAE